MQQRALDTKKKILDCAIIEFSEKGLFGARIDKIAERAEVNKQRIYSYYINKDGLFEAVLEHCFSEIAVYEEPLFDMGINECKSLTSHLLQIYFELHEKKPYIWKIIAWENLMNTVHKNSFKNMKARLLEHLKEIYLHGQTIKVFKKEVSFSTYLFTILSLSNFYFSNQKTLCHTLNRPFNTEKVRKQTISEICTLLSTQ